MIKNRIAFLLLLIAIIYSGCKNNSVFKTTTNTKILGQEAPGKFPVLFSPQVKEFEGFTLGSFALSPKGDEICLYKRDTTLNKDLLYYSKKVNDKWNKPVLASFAENGIGLHAEFSPDGNKLYFHASGDLWVSNKTDNGWGMAEKLSESISSEFYECGLSVAASGNFYFASAGRPQNKSKQCDIYCANNKAGKLDIAKHLHFNDESSECGVSVSPDERFLLISRYRPVRNIEIFICYKNEQGDWSKPYMLGPLFNMEWPEFPMAFSADGKYFFFQRYSTKDGKQLNEIFWVST